MLALATSLNLINIIPIEKLGVRCLAQGSHLSRGQFLPEPRFEPTTSGYKSNLSPGLPEGLASIRPRQTQRFAEELF